MNDYERLAAYGVATVYEGNGRRGLIDADLRCIVPERRAAGPARTVRCGQDDNLMVHAAIERIRPGEILVVAMPEPSVTSLMGDLLVLQAKLRGVAALLLDGGVRDTDAIRAMDVPTWARHIRVRTAGKTIVGELDGPLEIGGATIRSGDAVVLDADGGVAVQAGALAATLANCAERERSEVALRERLGRGELTLDINGLRRLLD